MAAKQKFWNLSFKHLAKILADIDHPDQMQALLAELLSQSECRDLALRWEILEQLAAGKSQREIANQLGVSLCKITRGAKILKAPRSAANTILETRAAR